MKLIEPFIQTDDIAEARLRWAQKASADRDKWRDIAGELAGALGMVELEGIPGYANALRCAWCQYMGVDKDHAAGCPRQAALARFDAAWGE